MEKKLVKFKEWDYYPQFSKYDAASQNAITLIDCKRRNRRS